MDAFTEIYESERQALFAFIMQRVHNFHDAEDILQETFLRAWKSLDRFRGECRVATWIHAIAVNEVKLFFQAAGAVKRGTRITYPIELEDGARLIPDPRAPDPSSGIVLAELQAELDAAVRSLPAKQRRAMLRVLDGGKCDGSSNTLFIARSKIRQWLAA